MCGIAGFLTRTNIDSERAGEIVARMTESLTHRGPDDNGIWLDNEAGLAFGHTRLSILDTSKAGHQPMSSSSGRYVIIFNGEIYNHSEIRAELENRNAAPEWRGHSDTEIFLASIEHLGIEDALSRTVGMFAFALWDKRDRTLQLARDRLGEKPIYFGWAGKSFIFGSELKALRHHPEFSNDISPNALSNYFRFAYVPAPLSIFENTYKLEPGCLLTINGEPPCAPNSRAVRPNMNHENMTIKRWWSLGEVVSPDSGNKLVNEESVIKTFDHILTKSIKKQLLADVPLGAFLSGGVDSSLIVALMQRESTQPIKTFTIGFEDKGYDESRYARAVAEHLGTDHAELIVSESETLAVIPRLTQIYDEPFADSSQIPTFLVSQAARKKVTVALSGDGGDELFGGYNRYLWGPKAWRYFGKLPDVGRHLFGRSLKGISQESWDCIGRYINKVRPGSAGISRPGEKMHKLADGIASAQSLLGLYHSLISQWPNHCLPVRNTDGINDVYGSVLSDPVPLIIQKDARMHMMYLDSLTYLPDDILCKVDRAAMATSLETRIPFLDHGVVEFAWQLPMQMKIRRNTGKWILRELLYRHVPRKLIERPKSGFGIPVGQWLKGPLRDWAESLLATTRIDQQSILEPSLVNATWQEHLSGERDWTQKLWTILIFQAWLEDL